MNETHNATIRISLITPETAKEFLSSQIPLQRPMRASHRNRLKQEMVAGTFGLSSDAIVRVRGKLANGQHRLSAVAESGIACPFLVMETDDENIYKLIDAGLKRTVGDLLSIQYAAQVSSVSSWVLDYTSGNMTIRTRKGRQPSTRTQITDYAIANASEISNLISQLLPAQKAHPVLSITAAVALLMIAPQDQRDAVRQFLDLLYKGSSDDSAFDLRERLIKNRLSKARLPATYIFGLLIKAYKSHFNGTRPGVLRISEDEEFPKL